MFRTIFLSVLVLGSALALTTLAMRAGDPPHSEALVEIQSGAVTIELAKPGSLLAINPETDCWQNTCPLLSIRSQFSAAAS